LFMLSSMWGPASKRVRLAYGRTGLEVDIPADADVLEPQQLDAVLDEAAVIRRALRDPIASEPLRLVVPRGAAVGISVCDVTRPFPASRVLPVVLDELEHLDPAQVTVFVATGTHRQCTATELLQVLGEEVMRRVRVVQHDALRRPALPGRPGAGVGRACPPRTGLSGAGHPADGGLHRAPLLCGLLGRAEDDCAWAGPPGH